MQLRWTNRLANQIAERWRAFGIPVPNWQGGPERLTIVLELRVGFDGQLRLRAELEPEETDSDDTLYLVPSGPDPDVV